MKDGDIDTEHDDKNRDNSNEGLLPKDLFTRIANLDFEKSEKLDETYQQFKQLLTQTFKYLPEFLPFYDEKLKIVKFLKAMKQRDLNN